MLRSAACWPISRARPIARSGCPVNVKIEASRHRIHKEVYGSRDAGSARACSARRWGQRVIVGEERVIRRGGEDRCAQFGRARVEPGEAGFGPAADDHR